MVSWAGKSKKYFRIIPMNYISQINQEMKISFPQSIFEGRRDNLKDEYFIVCQN